MRPSWRPRAAYSRIFFCAAALMTAPTALFGSRQGARPTAQSMSAIVEGYWYNSGTSNGRALIFGGIGARHALGAGREVTA